MYDVVIIGAGPAGIGLLSSMYRARIGGRGMPLKLCLIEVSDVETSGRLASYNIPSDTRAEKFLTCLDGLPDRILRDETLSVLTETLRPYGAKAVPLPIAGEFYRVLGALLCQNMASKGWLDVHANTKASRARWHGDQWAIETDCQGAKGWVTAKSLVMACGAIEERTRFTRFLERLDLNVSDLKSSCLSSDVLKAGLSAPIFQALKGVDNPKVTIIGGSHSAISSAGKLLLTGLPFELSAITIVHRSPMHATFDSAEVARSQGFEDFDDNDICPVSHRVFALKGFRLDSRDLLMAIKGYGDYQPENRITLLPVSSMKPDALKSQLKSADLVVSALGYKPAFVPLHKGEANAPIALNNPHYVDDRSRLLNAEKHPIPNCYALGLASNYNLAGRFGEPSFSGQANGLVLWHKDIGMEIASALLGE